MKFRIMIGELNADAVVSIVTAFVKTKERQSGP